MDAYSPFPVHGIDPAIGIQTFDPAVYRFGDRDRGLRLLESRDAVFILTVVLLARRRPGCNEPVFPGYAFRHLVANRIFSAPANIPVTFEDHRSCRVRLRRFLGMWFAEPVATTVLKPAYIGFRVSSEPPMTSFS